MQHNIILIGPPGAGKGTHSERLAQDFGLKHLSTGNILREIVSSGSDMGKEISDLMDEGDLVPDSIVDNIIFNEIKDISVKLSGFILDGYPRNLSQATELDDMLVELDYDDIVVICIVVRDGVILRRIAGRLICDSCSSVFNIYRDDVQEGWLCPECHEGFLYRRPDDNVDVVEQRLTQFKSQMIPVISYYDQEGILHEVDGNADQDDVYERILSVVISQKS